MGVGYAPCLLQQQEQEQHDARSLLLVLPTTHTSHHHIIIPLLDYSTILFVTKYIVEQEAHHAEHPVRLVEHEVLGGPQAEALGVLQVIH